MKINVFWFRRDLRLNDNTALMEALSASLPVLPVFIFDTNIIEDLPLGDARISFIHESLAAINHNLREFESSIYVAKGEPQKVWDEIITRFDIDTVFVNRDYEPYAVKRDDAIKNTLELRGIKMRSFKDQVIFEEKEVVKPNGTPYTVFTPYRNRWLKKYQELSIPASQAFNRNNYYKEIFPFPPLHDIGFESAAVRVKPYDLSVIPAYHKFRDIPSQDPTTHLGPHLRFGTVSIREMAALGLRQNSVFLDELIWREFFMQLLWAFPHVVNYNFRKKYDGIAWRNDEKEFGKWCKGETGYPMVDAGMRQLNRTGFMHNRVRMIAASFLCKHLLTDWRWGEAYFAEKLHDYELSSNNGNWQWTAGTGVDASQYFRIFNPSFQQKKFDPKNIYVKTWVEDYGKSTYPEPIVDHNFARERVIAAYRNAAGEQ